MENKLSRRKFIGLLGGAAVIASVPASVVDKLYADYMEDAPGRPLDKAGMEDAKKPGFHPNWEYGSSFPYSKCLDGYDAKLFELLINDAKIYIPPKYQHKIELRRRIPFDFGRHQDIAWYWMRLNDNGYLGKNGRWKLDKCGGYYLWERA